jgi:iduronate 2-sulfatase
MSSSSRVLSRPLSRRKFLRLGAVGLALAARPRALAEGGAPELLSGRKKNLLLIPCDDLGRYLGCTGHPVVRTPRLDELAARGTLFPNAVCQFPVCGPSRASFMTGMRPDTSGHTDQAHDLYQVSPDALSLATWLRRHGHETVRIGKLYNEWNNSHAPEWSRLLPPAAGRRPRTLEEGEVRGGATEEQRRAWVFDWRITEGNGDDLPDAREIDALLAWLKMRGSGEPFMAGLGLHSPHAPHVAPQSCTDLYPLESIALAPSWRPDYRLPRDAWEGRGPALEEVFSDEDRRRYRQLYYAQVSHLDRQLGRLIDALEQAGRLRDTTLVLFGDHGYNLGERGSWGKNVLWRESLQTPLLIVDPELPGGRVCPRSVELLDLAPTLTALLGLPSLPRAEGVSLLPWIEDGARPLAKPALAQCRRGSGFDRCVIEDEWHYLRFAGERGPEILTRQDAADPRSERNLATDPACAERIARYRMLCPI